MALPLALGGALVGGAIGTALVTRVLLGIGFGVVTYIGVQALWTNLQDGLWASLGQVSGNVMTLLVMARIDDAIAIVLSAGTSKLILRGLTAAGALKLARWKFID